MAFMGIYRLVIYVLVVVLSVPVIGLNADLTHYTNMAHVTYSFETLGLLIAALSLLVFPLLIIVSQYRKNAFLVYIVYELALVCIMWILWVVAAALTIQKKNELLGVFDSCSVFSGLDSTAEQKCNEIVAVEGIEVVIFVLLLKYMLITFVWAVVIHLRTGNGQVWFQSVNELEGGIPLTHKTDIDGASSSVPMGTYSNTAPQMTGTYANNVGGTPAQAATY
ncbi:hypothetical protein BDN70DRAFT_290949 [Pholiota conissans]|uniref:MARVEL domain-containing protein n=1 Tax=Pholiota conissans TaxID=109636 RepID=A0A9P6CX15_9AGAR|nr:hypothetical protein BDN70DRAFT_290949 [Pholiota conissans]